MVMAVLTHEFPESARGERPRGLRRLLDAWRRRREARRAMAELSRLDRRLLADIGLDPEAVATARDGWSDLLPNGYLVRRRR